MNDPIVNIFRSRDVSVTLNTLMNIATNSAPLEDYGTYVLLVGTAFPNISGIEPVSLLINGKAIPLIDPAGNIVVSGRMRDGRLDDCGNIESSKYLLTYGANGMPSNVGHFVVIEGLAPMTYNGTAGSNDNTTEV